MDVDEVQVSKPKRYKRTYSILLVIPKNGDLSSWIGYALLDCVQLDNQTCRSQSHKELFINLKKSLETDIKHILVKCLPKFL